MKINSYYLQRNVTFGFIGLAITYFVSALGFMTNFYQLFYNGTSEMYEYYKSLQVFNHVMFNIALVIVVMSILLLWFDVHKEKPTYSGLIYTGVMTVYALLNIPRIIRAVPYYQDIYTRFDYSQMNDYEPSILAFRISNIMSIAVLAGITLLFIIVIYRIIRKLTGKAGETHE